MKINKITNFDIEIIQHGLGHNIKDLKCPECESDNLEYESSGKIDPDKSKCWSGYRCICRDCKCVFAAKRKENYIGRTTIECPKCKSRDEYLIQRSTEDYAANEIIFKHFITDNCTNCEIKLDIELSIKVKNE